jgi:type III secretion protein J
VKGERHLRKFSPVLLILIALMMGCSQPLHHGLTEEQANEILVILQNNGIHAEKTTEEGGETVTFIVTVPQRDSSKAWQIMRENDLPKPAKKGFGEVFGKTSLIPTAMEERALFLQAICGELAKTIEAINGVVDARVHVVLPESDILKQELQGPTLSKAAVLIKYKTDRSGNPPFKAEDIRQLVANSVEGLKPSDVSVVSSQVYSDKPPDLIYVWPLTISKNSLLPFQILVGLLVVVFLIVGVMLVLSARSSMSLKKELARLRAAGGRQLATTAEK